MNWSDFIIVIAVAGAVTGLLVPLVSTLCHRLNLLDIPGQHKSHRIPTPRLGGVAIFIGFWSSIALALWLYPVFSEELGPFMYYIFGGGLVIFLLGCIDDIGDLPAPMKLAAELGVGMILYLEGLQIDVIFIPFHGPAELGFLSLPVTLIWFAGITNCINLIDGLDGLAAGVSAIAALVFLFVGVYFALATVTVFATGMIGACIVFLYFNHYPARIFMGDSGSLFLGYLFAVLSILFPIKTFATAAIFVPILALGVPIFETVLSFSRRVVSGQKFYQADKQHIFHYLTASGLSPSQVVWLFYIVSSIFAVFAGAMFIVDKRLVFTVMVVFMVVIFAVLLRLRLANGRIKWKVEDYG